MFVFGKRRTLELASQADSLKDAIFVFEGDFSVPDDKRKLVDTILGLWSLMLLRKEKFFEVQLLYARCNTERRRTFPKEYCGDLPAMLEAEMATKKTGTLAAESSALAAFQRRESANDLMSEGVHVKVTDRTSNATASSPSKALVDPIAMPPSSNAVDSFKTASDSFTSAGGTSSLSSTALSSETVSRAEHERLRTEHQELLGKYLSTERLRGQLQRARAQAATLEQRLQSLSVPRALSPSLARAPSPSLEPSPSLLPQTSALTVLGPHRSARAVQPSTLKCLSIHDKVDETDLAAELHALGVLCGVDLDDSETLRRAAQWCQQAGAASIDHIADPNMAEAFVAALGTKPIPSKRLLAALQPTNSIHSVAIAIGGADMGMGTGAGDIAGGDGGLLC